MRPTTPIGSRRVKSSPGRVTGIVEPRSLVVGARVELEDLGDLADLPAGAADGLADLPALERSRARPRASRTTCGEAQQQPAAIGRRHRAPLAVERRLGGGDRAIHVDRATQRRRRDDRAPVRLDDLERAAVGGLDRGPRRSPSGVTATAAGSARSVVMVLISSSACDAWLGRTPPSVRSYGQVGGPRRCCRLVGDGRTAGRRRRITVEPRRRGRSRRRSGAATSGRGSSPCSPSRPSAASGT